MKYLKCIVGCGALLFFLCASIAAAEPNSRTHGDKGRQALMRACKLMLGEYDKEKHEQAERELEIARRELKLAEEAARKELEIAKREMEEVNQLIKQSPDASRRKSR